jgi:hypothetical protein
MKFDGYILSPLPDYHAAVPNRNRRRQMIRLHRSILFSALLAFTLATPLHADFKKPYFGKTKVGSWADYRSDDGITYRYTRLTDAGKQVRLSLSADFSKTKYAETPPSTTQYTLEEGFAWDRDGLSFGRFATEILTMAAGSQTQALEGIALKNIRAFATDYAPIATFKGTETVNGKPADHYAYRTTVDGRTETGDLWLSGSVPFGLVKQSAKTTDAAGAVISQFVMELTGSGASGSKAVVLETPAAGAPPEARPFSLEEAYDDEAVRLKVEVVKGSKGARLHLTLVNKLDSPVEITVPKGSTTFHGGDPVESLTIESASEQKLTIGPGDEQTIDVTQEPIVVGDGTFELSIYEEEPLFSGSATLVPRQ